MREGGEIGTEQARRLGRDDRLESADLVARDAAAPQQIRVAGLEQAAGAGARRRGGGLDPRPDRRGGSGGELLVHHLDEQAVGDVPVRRRRDADRAGPHQGGPQRWMRLGRRQKMRVDLGIEHRFTPHRGPFCRGRGRARAARRSQHAARARSGGRMPRSLARGVARPTSLRNRMADRGGIGWLRSRISFRHHGDLLHRGHAFRRSAHPPAAPGAVR
ncbi:hypothetical protein ACRAWG_26835 [Methylobacterium sp. P31]